MPIRDAGLTLLALATVATAGLAQSGTPVTFMLHDASGAEVPLRTSVPATLPGPMLNYPPAGVAGTQQFVVIGCRYGDVAGEPVSTSGMNALVGATYPGLSHYFNEVSNGVVDLAGSIAIGWQTLPNPMSYYFPGGTPDAQRLYLDCMAAHDAAVNYPTYAGIIMVFNDSIPGVGYFQSFASQGTIPVTIDGFTKPYRLVFIGSATAGNQFVWAHQIGHTFDLQHSSAQPLSATNSYWDMMSKGGYVDAGFAPRIAIHPKALDKYLLGWIPPARVYTAAIGSRVTIALERSAQPSANTDYLLARVPTGTSYYTVEARRVAGYDRLGDSALAGEGVVVHQVVPSRSDPLAEVMTTNGLGLSTGGFLLPGQSFTDAANQVKISVLSQGTTDYAVQVCLQYSGSGLIGDVNGDGVINVIDAQIIARYSVGLSVPNAILVQSNGDANGDGSVNIIDAQVVARYAVGLPTPGSPIGQNVASGC